MITFGAIVIAAGLIAIAVGLTLIGHMCKRLPPGDLRGLFIPMAISLTILGAGAFVAFQVDPPAQVATEQECR